MVQIDMYLSGNMIKICVPFYSEWDEVKKSLPSIVSSGIHFEVSAAQGPYIAQSRNALINKESSQSIIQDIGDKYSHYLFIDSDIGFNSHHIESILSLHTILSF